MKNFNITVFISLLLAILLFSILYIRADVQEQYEAELRAENEYLVDVEELMQEVEAIHTSREDRLDTIFWELTEEEVNYCDYIYNSQTSQEARVIVARDNDLSCHWEYMTELELIEYYKKPYLIQYR